MLMTIRPRGDIAANWDKANPILKQRELAFEWETSIGVGKPRFKIGDGVTAWKDLPYSIDATGYWDELSEEDKKVLANTGSPDSIRLKTNNGTLEYNGEKAVFQKNDSGDGNTDCIIEGIANPTEDNQATNKKYVDDKTQTASDTIQGTVKASDQVIVNENGALEIGRLLDTYGIVNSSKTQQFVQDLIDNISNKVINDLISKNMISNVQVNSNSNIPSSSLVYGMNNQISELNAKAQGRLKIIGPISSADNEFITIEFPTLPNHRTAFILLGNANAQAFMAVVIYENVTNAAQISYIYPSSNSTDSVEINGNQFTISNLRRYGYFYALCPWL